MRNAYKRLTRGDLYERQLITGPIDRLNAKIKRAEDELVRCVSESTYPRVGGVWELKRELDTHRQLLQSLKKIAYLREVEEKGHQQISD